MVILQGGLVIVENGQGTRSLDEEVVVQASLLVVMHDGRTIGGHVLGPTDCLGCLRGTAAYGSSGALLWHECCKAAIVSAKEMHTYYPSFDPNAIWNTIHSSIPMQSGT